MSWRASTSALRHGRAGAVALMLVAVFTVAMTSASAARASGPDVGPFGLTPSPTPSGTPRSYFSLAAAPGRTVRDSVVVTNLSRGPERLRLVVSEGVTAANSGSAYEAATRRCATASCWISGLPRIVRLGPRQVRLVGFVVHVPRRTAAGQYLAGVTALAAKKPRPVTVGSRGHASARAIIVDEVTVGVAVTVGDLARLPSGLRVGQVSAGWIGSVPRLSIPVSNTGRTFLRGSGWIRCAAADGTRTYPVIMETVLPGQNAVLPVNARGLRAGTMDCLVRLRTDNRRLIGWSGTVALASRTLTRTYHPSKGVYVSLPAPTTPPWAIALMAVGVLTLFGLLLVLIQRRRSAAFWPAVGEVRPPRRSGPGRGRRLPVPGTWHIGRVTRRRARHGA